MAIWSLVLELSPCGCPSLSSPFGHLSLSCRCGHPSSRCPCCHPSLSCPCGRLSLSSPCRLWSSWLLGLPGWTLPARLHTLTNSAPWLSKLPGIDCSFVKTKTAECSTPHGPFGRPHVWGGLGRDLCFDHLVRNFPLAARTFKIGWGTDAAGAKLWGRTGEGLWGTWSSPAQLE